MTLFRIAPSILAADIAKLGEEVSTVVAAGADFIHIDVMDNHYVPNLTFGPLLCQALRDYGITAPLDVHLMIKPVDRIIPEFAKAGATYISFHPEASEHIHRSIQIIHDYGCKAGLAFNPATPLNHLDHIINELDLILIMSVNPGFGGQKFLPEMLPKIKSAREKINSSHKEILLEVDGGINLETMSLAAQAGADTFVAGTAIFKTSDYKSTITQMRNQLKSSFG